MDTDNIASVLKDALNASISKIQNESKRTKVFVLPPELLKGLLVKNEIPKVDNTAKAGTSNSKNSKETTKNNKQSLENSKSTTLPVDLPKRTNNRQSATKESSKNTRSRTPSTKKRASKNEQKQEESTVLNDNETSDTSKSIEKNITPKRSYRGRKSKAKAENESLELSNIKTSSDTKSDKVKKTIQNNHDIQNFSIDEVSNKPLDDSSVEKSAKISDEIEEKCIENDHELHEAQEDNLPKPKASSATISDETEEKCTINDHEMQDLLTDEIFNNTVQVDSLAKPKASSATISDETEESTEQNHEFQDLLTDEIFNNTVQEDNLISIKNDDLNCKKKLGEESLEVADSKTEIIDQVLQDSHVKITQSNTSQKVSNELISAEVELHDGKEKIVPSELNLSSNDDETIIIEEETYIVEEIIEVIEESDDESSMPNDDDKVNKVEDIVIKTEKDLTVEDVDFPEMINNPLHLKPELTVEKDSIDSEPDVEQTKPNNMKVYVNRRKSRKQPNSNAVKEKSAMQINFNYNENNLIDTTLKDTSLEKLSEELQSLTEVQEKHTLKFDSHCVHEIIADIAATEAPLTNSLKLKCSQKIPDQSISEIEFNVDQKNLINSTLIETENSCQEKDFSQISQEQFNSETKNENNHIILNTKLLKMSNVNACEELKYKESVLILENDIKKTDENEISDSAGASVENLMDHTENTKEIQSIDSIEKTNNTLENLENQTENVEMKTPNRRSPRKSENSNADSLSPSKPRIKNIEIIVEGTKVEKDSTDITVNNDIEKNTDVTDHKNNDLDTSNDFCKNENVSTIKSLRQLRNRIKVVPRVPVSLRKLKSNIEKESLHLKTSENSDIVPKNDFDISNSTQSVSLDVKSKSPEKLCPSAKRITRKHKSVDNHLVNENRMSSLRRRSAILENERKLQSVSEDDDHKESSEITDCKKDVTVEDSSDSKDLKDRVDTSSGSTEKIDSATVEKAMNDGTSSGIGDLQNAKTLAEKAINETKLSSKPEKVIVVRKIQKGRRSKSSQPKDDPTLTTNVEKKDGKSEQVEKILKVTDEAVSSDTTVERNQIEKEDSKIAKNKDKIEDTLGGKLNDSAVDSPTCQMDIDVTETALSVENEKVIPATRAKRGTHAKSTSSNEIATENTKDTFDTKNNNYQVDSVDLEETDKTASSQKTAENTNLPEVNAVDKTLESNSIDTDCLVHNALEDNHSKIKSKKVTPVRKGRKGRRSKSTSSNVANTENIDDNVDINKNNQELEIAGNLIDRKEAATTTDNKKIEEIVVLPTENIDKTTECSSNETSDADCQVKSALDDDSLKTKTEQVSPCKRGRTRSRSKSTSSNVIAESTDNNSDINKSGHKLEDVDDSNIREEAAIEDSTTISKEASENIILSNDRPDEKLESNTIDVSIAESSIDNAEVESDSKVKSETVTPVIRGRRGRRPKATPIVNSRTTRRNKDDKEQAVTTTDNEKIDENVVLPTDNKNETSECISHETSNADRQVENALDDDSSKIKPEIVSPGKRSRTRSRSKSTSSNVIAETTDVNSDVNKSIHKLETVDDSNIREEAVIDDSITTCKEEDDKNTIILTDNFDKTLESSTVDVSVAESSIDNAEAESDSKIKSETVAPVTRGRRGRRPRAKPLIVNTRRTKRNEDDGEDTKDDVSTEVTGDVPIAVTFIPNEIGDSTVKDEEIEKVSDDVASSESSAKPKPPEVSSVKKGRRGRRPKNFQINDSVNEKEITSNDCTSSVVESNVDSEETSDVKVEEEKPVDISMDVDSISEENNVTQDDNLDTTGIDDEVKEEQEIRGSRLSRRSSRHEKLESTASNVSDVREEPKKRGRRSTKTAVKREKVDSDDEPKEKDLGMMEARRSGRRQRSAVNYRVPDEDCDVVASEAQSRQKPVEKGPKKRRGRPSLAEMLARAAAEKSLEREKDVDIKANDSDSASVASNEPTRKKRATKSTINPDIFDVDSETVDSEKSLDVSDDVQKAESDSDAADDTHDFEDSHCSDKEEEEEEDDDEDFVEQPKRGRRGKKRKGRFNIYKPRKRGRPKKSELEESDDDDYFPHHSYVPQPTKSKDKTKETPEKRVVKCGKCAKEVPRHQWYSHNLFSHNDMGWVDGAPKPDFDNDQKLLMRVLTLAHKKKHKKGLVCESCREIKKSVVGFISHITFCGKTEEEMLSLLITCEICGARFKPSSMEYHERQHRLEVDIKKKKEQEMALKEQAVIDALEPRSKRKAAEKAVSKISEFTALVKDADGSSVLKHMKFSSPIIKKFIQAPQAMKKISSLTIAKWNKDLESNQDAACTQFGCTFKCKSLDEMKEHYSSCNFTPTQNYMCKICRYQTPFEDDIVQHANEKHTNEDLDRNVNVSGGEGTSDEDYSEVDEDSSNQGQVLVKKFVYKETTEVENKMFKFIFNNGTCYSMPNKTFLPGFEWTLEFERKHFKFSIFDNFAPNTFIPLEENDAKDYLPQVDQSMPVRFAKKESPSEPLEWKNWSRFEAARIDDSPTFFVGGPIWAMAWAPTPSFLASSDDVPQFLAISTHPSMDIEYASGKSYSGKNIIQIWSVGKLNNRTTSEEDPELSYAIAHNGGTVWSLEWCPSGCYQHEDFPILKGENNSNRLGLLAAGCSDGCVRIYSLIFPQNLPSSSENQYPIYKTEPVATLVINTHSYDNNSATWQVLKICWSREANHNVIVAGFSNGYVGFWDLTTTSPFLKYQVDNTTFFRPYKLFFAHHHAVTMLALVSQDNRRYLATASLDRFFKFWDLEDISKPKNTFKRSYVTDGSWFNNWNCAVLAYDEALCMGHNISICLPLRDYTYKHYNLLPSNCTTYAIATSDFANSLATGNIAGELLTLFPHQIIYYREMERTIPPKRVHSLISTMELVDFNAGNTSPVKKDKRVKKVDPYKDPADFMPSSYDESKDRFGIQFNSYMNAFDSNMKRPKKHPRKQTLTCENLEKVPIEQYPLKSINKVAWNPNASSFLWLATGYQSGFVRLFSFRAIASTPEWNRILQSHTDELKTQMAEETSEEDC